MKALLMIKPGSTIPDQDWFKKEGKRDRLLDLCSTSWYSYSVIENSPHSNGGHYMRADRLLSILLLLQTKGRMTAHDLADRLEVSERTIYRDLEALGIAGIPIYAERGPGGGCELVDGYQTKLTGLTEEEVQALFLATMTGPLSDLGLGKALDDALLKVLAALPVSTRDQAVQLRQRVHLDAAWWYHSADLTGMLHTIQQALWQD